MDDDNSFETSMDNLIDMANRTTTKYNFNNFINMVVLKKILDGDGVVISSSALRRHFFNVYSYWNDMFTMIEQRHLMQIMNFAISKQHKIAMKLVFWQVTLFL